jgi:16S rRNA processing protein RimM
VARIGRPHGVRGEVTVVVEADDPSCLAPGSVLLTEEPAGLDLIVVAARPHRGAGWIVAFEGISTRDGAEQLRGTTLCIPAEERRALQQDEFWPEQLVGLVAVDAGGEVLGEVTGVELGGQDRLVVTTPTGAEVLVPFVADLVGDPEGGRIRIDPPAGLFDPR